MATGQTFEKRIFILLSVIVGFYILLRAVYFPVFTDEVATFFMYVQTGRIFPPDIAWDANNHFLNSILVRASYLLFGPSIFALRLPNLLFVPLYFYYVYKTGRLIQDNVVRWTFFSAMVGTHFVIEYLGYARGYGMSLALLTGAVWYLIKALQKFKTTDVVKSLLFAILAISANLNLIITFILIFGLLVVCFVVNFRELRIGGRVLVITVFVISGLSLWFFTDYSFTLLEKGRLYCGSSDGFWDNTILSLSAIVYSKVHIVFALYFAGMIVLSALVYAYLLWIKRELPERPSPGVVFLVLITGNIFAALAMHYLFGVLYQEDRIAIYYIPLFIGLASFTLDQLIKLKGRYLVFGLLPIWLLPFFSLEQISLVKSSHDSTPYVPYSFFSEVSSSVEPGKFPPVVTGVHKRKLVWSYFNYLSGGKMNPILFSDDPVLYAGYLMYNFDEREKPLQLYDEIDFDESSGLSLMKRKTEPQKSVLIVDSIKRIPLTLNKEYFKILQIPVDTVRRTALLVNFDFEIESDAVPFEGTFVCELRDSTGARTYYDAINLDQMHPVWNSESDKVYNSLLLPLRDNNSTSLLIYFWNKRKVEYRILKGRSDVSYLR